MIASTAVSKYARRKFSDLADFAPTDISRLEDGVLTSLPHKQEERQLSASLFRASHLE